MAELDREFLESLRRTSEAGWRDHVPRNFEALRVGGLDWQSGTRWRGGLTDSEIVAAEERFGLIFPPDYRLFLSVLHTPDPEMVGARFVSTLVPAVGRRFPDWTGDPESIETLKDRPVEGLLCSVEHSKGWHPKWGPMPLDRLHRERLVRDLAAAGARLIPVWGHHFLAGPAHRIGNPVLSFSGSDVILFAPDLRSELQLVTGLTRRPTGDPRYENQGPIPFWQDIIDDGLPERFE